MIVFAISLLVSVFNIGRVLAAEPLFKLSNATILDKSDGVEASIEGFSNDELITNTTFHKIDDYVKYNLTIKNTSKSKYKLVLVNDNNSSDNITYEYEYEKDEEIEPKSEIDVVLKITYNNGVTDINKRTQNKEVKISFILEDEEENVVSVDITNNPKTGDNIWIYYMTAFVSLLCLLLIVFRKKISKLLFIAILLVPVIIFAVSPSLVIIIKNNTNLFDKILVNKVVNGENQTIIVDYNDKIEKPADPVIAGYEFVGWYVGDKEYNFDEPLTEDMILTAKFNLIEYSISYELDSAEDPGNPTSYNVETESFDLINPSKEGYTFAGWTGSNGNNLQTRVTIEKGSTGDKSFVAHYSANQNTPYTVNHKYRKLDGTFDTEVEELTGPTDEKVYPAVRSKTGFENPEVKELIILPNGNAYIDYEYERKEYTLTIQSSEYVETTFTEDKYPYETEITLTAKNRAHYDFVKWSNDSTNNPLVFNITENTIIEPVYQIKQYTVSFDAQGGVDVDGITKDYNTQIGNLPETVKDGYLFDGWFTLSNGGTKIETTTLVTGNIAYYAHWSKSMSLATLSPESITVTRLQNQTITVSNVEEEYTFTSGNNSIATVDETGKVTGASKGNTTITIEGVRSHAKKTVNVTVNPIMCTVSFNSDGGGTFADRIIEENYAVGSLPIPEKEGYNYVGWYTEDGTTRISDETIITDTTTFVAHWDKVLCKKAQEGTLHTETCNQASNTGCLNAGYTNGSTITYGNIPGAGSPVSGDAYDCDVNNDGTFDPDTERFYFIRKNTSGSIDTAVLVYSTSFDEDGRTDNSTEREIYLYDDGKEWLPDSTVWSNPALVPFEGNVSRYIKQDDVVAACGEWSTSDGYLNNCQYFMENSRFQSNTLGRSAIWMEKINNSNYRIDSRTRKVTTVKNDARSSVRPVIEFSYTMMDGYIDYIDYSDFTVDFNAHEGVASFTSKTVTPGSSVGELPTASREGYIFVGWFTESSGGTQINENTKITQDVTFHARYIIKRTVTFDGNGGTLSFTTKEVGDGRVVGELPEGTYENYEFVGWYTDDSWTTQVTETTIINKNETFIAKWNYIVNPDVVSFNMDNNAMSTYYSSVSTWLTDTSTFQTNMDTNFNNYSCFECNGPKYQSCPTPTSTSVLCDQSLGYDTGTNAEVKVYESDEINKTKGSLVSYTTSTDGVIYNMIPGQTYYWELASDSSIYGLVKANGTRRTIKTSVRNVRDLGGLNATYTDDLGTHSGTLKYGILYRGAKIESQTGATELAKLGISEELDLRGNNSDPHVGTYKYKSIVNYKFDQSESDRQDFRDAITMAMQDVVSDESIFFHCAIGTDRTGTLAYFLEGLLGVSREDKLEDYELSYFTGLLNRTRFHDNLSGSSINPRFTTMANTYDTNDKIYNWYINDPDNQASDIQLVKDFRNKMIILN